MTEHNTRRTVVVIGGGCAGALVANHLRMHAGIGIIW